MRKLAAGVLIGLLAGVLVGMSPAGATDVSDEAGLRAAFDTDSQIDLLNDITLEDCQSGDLNRSASAPVTIDGHGFTITQICPDNILEPDDSDVTLQDVTLTGGHEPDDGGAIDMNGGDLTVLDSTVRDNCAADSAGAIENEDGSTTIIRSTINGNAAEDQAGAIRSKRGDTYIENSTITGNQQAVAGAVDSGQQDATEASLTLVYSTIVENQVHDSILCQTVNPVGPEADDEGAEPQGLPAVANVHAVDALRVSRTVIALPLLGPNCSVADATSLGFNYSDDATCGLDQTTDTENGADPLLASQDDNGGPTATRLPEPGSPLIDAIPIADCGGIQFDPPFDQRGVTRPQGDGCDIGAVEVEVDEAEPEPPPPPAAEPAVVTPTFTG